MKCPVCEKEMASMVCSCGYDESRDYERYPTLGALPGRVVSVAGLRDRRKNLIRCGGCGNHGFSLDIQEGKLCCLNCGRALTQEELLPLRQAMGWEKPAPEKKEPVQSNDLRRFMDVLEQVRQQAEAQQPDPKRIVGIAGGRNHTVALYADGTVAAIGDNRSGQCNVSEWRDIVAITASWDHTTGVKRDGTVVVTGNDYGIRNKVASTWADIVEVADGTFHTVGRTGSGTAVAVGDKARGKLEVSQWRNLRAIAASNYYTVGLREDGTVVTAGWGKLAKNQFNGWRDITAIATSDSCTVGLHKDGTVVYAGSNCEGIERWSEIADIQAGAWHIVGLKRDGTARAAGFNTRGQCLVGTWKDLEAIAAGDSHTIGLKKDGTLVATGDNRKGQCDVEKLVRK